MGYFTEVTERIYTRLLEEGIPSPSRLYECSFEDEDEVYFHLEWDTMLDSTRDYICSLLDKISTYIAKEDTDHAREKAKLYQNEIRV